jgi:hydrogenase maturation protease
MSASLLSSTPSWPTLVVGLGNPLLGDDGVGWRAAEQIERQVRLLEYPVEVDCLATGGLSLMERLIGYQHVILIDAIFSGRVPVGSIQCLTLDDLPDLAAGHLSSAHDTTLPTAFGVGRALGVPLPDDVAIVAVETAPTFDFAETLTPPVAAAVSPVTQLVIERLADLTKRKNDDGIS